VSVIGTPFPGGDAETLVTDYARCAAWAAESGADAVEVHLATPDPFAEPARLVSETVPPAAQPLHRVRTRIGVPVQAKLGASRTPPLHHGTAASLAAWTNGFVWV